MASCACDPSSFPIESKSKLRSVGILATSLILDSISSPLLSLSPAAQKVVLDFVVEADIVVTAVMVDRAMDCNTTARVLITS